MITYRNNLDMTPGGIPPVIHLNQYDDDFQLIFDLYTSIGQFTIQTGTTAEIRGTKGDNNGYTASATISNNTVTVTGHKQMTAVAGRNVFELVLTKSSKDLSTVNFILDVERAAMDADTIQSETVLRELNAIIAGATTATEAASAAAASAAAAAESARTLTIDNTLTQQGQAADAKKTGDEIADLKSDLDQKGLTEDAKTALLDCFAHIAWLDGDGEAYYEALRKALHHSDRRPELPDIYEQVEYIKANGKAYTVLDINSQVPLRAEIKAAFKGSDSALLAAASSNANARFYLIGLSTQDGVLAFRNRFGNTAWFGDTTSTPSYNEVYDIVSGIETIDNVTKAFIRYGQSSAEHTISAPVTNLPINVMRLPSDGSISSNALLYGLKMYSGDTLLFDGIPCFRKSDDVSGLYDVVSENFYYSAGTSNFDVGEIID